MHPERLRALVSAALALMVVACGPVQSPEPSRSATVSSQPQAAETMVVGVHIPADRSLGHDFGLTATDLPLYSLHPNGSLWDPVVGRFVYSGVYRLDEAQSPVPDLAEEPCAVSEDLLVVTCTLRDVSFHDGTPLTADDVAFTYQLLLSDACMDEVEGAAPRPRQPGCLTPDVIRLEAVEALDERTVEFRLSEPDPSLFTAVMPDVLIEPRALVEAAYAEFVESSNSSDPTVLVALASRVGASTCEPPDESALGDAELAIAEIGRTLRSRDAYGIGPGGEFDACAYGEYLVRVLGDAADAMSFSGIDAIAAAYPILEPPETPIGSGPWRVLSIDPGVSMGLQAFDAFHRGVPATTRLEVRLIQSTADAIETVRSGDVDWLLEPFTFGDNLIAAGIGEVPGVAWTEYNALVFYDLEYNLREGRLFADPNLRAAMELCVDKDETVAAATGGQGVSIYSPIIPSMWAFEPDLPRPTRDVDTGQELIEASGWTRGADGIYQKGDQRLTATVPMLDGQEPLRFLELLAVQVAECGIEIIPQPMSYDDFLVALTWPLVAPGEEQPWDAVFSGWISAPEPDQSAIYHSRAIATESNPEGFNYIGYASERGDALLDQARATYDQRERARLYREFQELLAEDRPVMYAWSPRIREARNDRLESTQDPLASDTSTWWWQLETLFVRSQDP
jgi:ABC-type transport system substrate-binding protein